MEKKCFFFLPKNFEKKKKIGRPFCVPNQYVVVVRLAVRVETNVENPKHTLTKRLSPYNHSRILPVLPKNTATFLAIEPPIFSQNVGVT